MGMSLVDVILTAVYMALCYAIGNYIKNTNQKNPLYNKWFMKGLSAKLWGGFAFALVYTFYFDYGGDSRAYWSDASVLTETLLSNPSVYYDVLSHKVDNISSEAFDILNRMSFHAQQEYYVSNLISIFNLLAFKSYFSTTLLVALFTYWGVWHFFLLLVEKYPTMEKQMAIAALFVPSVFFWGSGISKDSLILCCVGLILYHIDKIASGRFWQVGSIALIALTGYYMFIVKPYVLVSLVPAIGLWRTLYLRDKIKVKFIRTAVLPIVGALSVIVMVISLDFLAKYNARYSMDSFVDTAQSMQGWHYKEGENTADQHGRGSSYTLGEYDQTSWKGLLKVFPAAINVTYFRPYLWEVKNAGMLAQAIESLLFLMAVVFVLMKVGPRKTYAYIANDSFLLMCVVFAVFFGFAVGFSSYNFGALSRYKIPAVPFFVAALLIIRNKAIEAKANKRKKYSREKKGQIQPVVA